MKNLLVPFVFAAGVAAANVAMAGTTLKYLNLDTGASAVTEGDDLFPYVCDQAGNDLRGTPNAGFLRIGKGKTSYLGVDASVATENEELTVEFFIKGGPDGVTVWSWLFSLGGTWSGAKQSIVIDANAAKNIRLRVASVAVPISPNTCAASAETSASLTDGKWHHVAVTIKPINDGAGSHVNGYVDYAKVLDKDLSSPYLYANTSNCLDLNRTGGGNNANSGVDFDEIRFTRGVLEPKDFLRLEGNPPVDGETLLYLPFDADAKTIAHVERQGAVNGTPALVDAQRTHTAVKERGTGVTVRRWLANCTSTTITGHFRVRCATCAQSSFS